MGTPQETLLLVCSIVVCAGLFNRTRCQWCRVTPRSFRVACLRLVKPLSRLCLDGVGTYAALYCPLNRTAAAAIRAIRVPAAMLCTSRPACVHSPRPLLPVAVGSRCRGRTTLVHSLSVSQRAAAVKPPRAETKVGFAHVPCCVMHVGQVKPALQLPFASRCVLTSFSWTPTRRCWLAT